MTQSDGDRLLQDERFASRACVVGCILLLGRGAKARLYYCPPTIFGRANGTEEGGELAEWQN